MVAAVNVIMNVFLLLLLSLLSFQAHRSCYGRDKKERRLFQLFLLSMVCLIGADTLTWVLEGAASQAAWWANFIFTSLFYELMAFPTLSWLIYLDYKLFGNSAARRRRILLYWLPFLLLSVPNLFNYWTGWYFTISEAGLFSRGPGNLWTFIVSIGYGVAASIYAGVRYLHSRQSREEKRATLYVIFMPLPMALGAALQWAYYGLPISRTALVFSAFFYYINDQLAQLRRVHQLENELIQSRVAIMLTQIKPHFLYNALTAIADACEPVPKAQKAVMDFSNYLRGNLDSVNNQGLIRFENELNHIKAYLRLETMRFGELLNVVYHISALDFLLPPLTVQPLVENAVKHGVGKKPKGGTVEITSEETHEAYVITVSDDGVGFDPDELPDDGKSHVGVENVRMRLWAQCQGTLALSGKKGTGTAATIKIPKKASG